MPYATHTSITKIQQGKSEKKSKTRYSSIDRTKKRTQINATQRRNNKLCQLQIVIQYHSFANFIHNLTPFKFIFIILILGDVAPEIQSKGFHQRGRRTSTALNVRSPSSLDKLHIQLSSTFIMFLPRPSRRP